MNLTEGDMRAQLMQLAIPSCVAFFFATMLYVVDTFFAGTISTGAQAALSISFPIYFIIISFIQGVSIGAQTLISNALGEGNSKKALFLCCQALSFGILTGILLTVLGYSFAVPVLKLIGTKGDALDHAAFYMEYTFLFSTTLILTNAINAIFMAHGIARPFRNWVIVAFLLHLIFDPWLIYGGFGMPAFGFDGIVYTTVITMVIGLIFMSITLWESHLMKDSTLSDFTPRLSPFVELIRQGLPACMNMMSIAFGLMLIMGFILVFGEKAAAAYGIGIRIHQIFLLPTLGISIATLAIVGQNNGAGHIDRIKECLRQTFYFGFTLLSIGFIPLFFFPEALMKIFTDDHEVIDMGATFLRITSITGFAFMTITFYTSALQGMKYPMSAFVIGFGRQVIMPTVLLPLLFLWYHATLESIWIMLLIVNFIFSWIAYYLTQRALKKREAELKPI